MIVRLPLALGLLLLTALAAFPQQNQRNMVKEQRILDELSEIAPAAVPDFQAGTEAMDADKFDDAVFYYEKVRQLAPEYDAVLRRLGICLVGKGEVQTGTEFLRQAVARKRSPENLISLANALAYPGHNKKSTDQQKEEAYKLALEADRLPKTSADSDYHVTLAQHALNSGHDDVFRQTTKELVATHPERIETHYFNSILLAYDEEWIKAEDEILKAESMGLPHEAAQEILDADVHSQARLRRYAWYAFYLITAWIIGLVVLFLLGKLMSRWALNSIESTNPNHLTSKSDLSLRMWYRWLINIGGLYYYISIPFVIFIVAVVAGGLIYCTFSVGRIPIKLVLIVCCAALVTIFQLIRSLFIKIEKTDPGRALRYEEAPGLWDLTRKIAATLNTRPVDEIRITPGTDLAVYENGTWRERSKDEARRILILGVGVLNDFHVSGFRAVLAHEYGHLRHRDTAGGDVALRVNNDMMKFAHAMIEAGQNVSWNLAFQFLRIYHFIFRRLSHGATRLQEVMADRVSARKFGAAAFEEGLRHVVRKSAEFKFVANFEINESAHASRALQNLYELQMTSSADLDEEVERLMNRVTTEDDTHPSPNERFRLTRKIVSQSEPPMYGMVWDLFRDRTALTLEMTSTIESMLRS